MAGVPHPRLGLVQIDYIQFRKVTRLVGRLGDVTVEEFVLVDCLQV